MSAKEERRPASTPDGAPKATTLAASSISHDTGASKRLVPVTGAIRLDVSRLERDRAHQCIRELYSAPAGVHVELIVRRGQAPACYCGCVQRHATHLGSVTVKAPDSDTTAEWMRALRGDFL